MIVPPLKKGDRKDYPYIRAWGKYLGSFAYYINDQIDQANQDGAPEDAVYKNNENVWVTFGQLNADSQALLKSYLAKRPHRPRKEE